MNEIKYGILASGRLGLICIEKFLNERALEFVFTDKSSTSIISLCNKLNLPVFVGNPRGQNAAEFIEKYEVDVLLSVNYLFIINENIIEKPKKYAINFHGSLLPKYRGRTPHIWAIINNESEAGITAHLITEECDEGDIIYQENVFITNENTGAELLEKYNVRYPDIINIVVQSIENNSLVARKQIHENATYFHKRTPDDGLIDWNWQKERINNWVRALANPYPGAFTFYNGVKVVINRIEYTEYGFDANDKNGQLLEVLEGVPIIKTPNGAVKLVDINCEFSVKFEPKSMLK